MSTLDRGPGSELVGVADGPDVPDPVAAEVEGEHRRGHAVGVLQHQARLAVDRALDDGHVVGDSSGESDVVAGDALRARDGMQRGANVATTISDRGSAG